MHLISVFMAYPELLITFHNLRAFVYFTGIPQLEMNLLSFPLTLVITERGKIDLIDTTWLLGIEWVVYLMGQHRCWLVIPNNRKMPSSLIDIQNRQDRTILICTQYQNTGSLICDEFTISLLWPDEQIGNLGKQRLLVPAYEVRRDGMFSQASVC